MASLKKVVSAVRITVNSGVDIPVKAGSVEYYDGAPKREHKAADNGDVYFGKNYEDAYGYITFMAPASKEVLDRIRELEKLDSLSLSAVEVDGDWSRTMPECSMEAGESRKVGSSGEVSFKFCGIMS